MIKVIRFELPNFEPDPGVTRTQIGDYWVEWTDNEPTIDDVYLIIGSPLGNAKASKINEIDARTQQLISNGFTFDSSIFSLSHEAQMNWTNLMIASGLVSYPLDVSTLNDGKYTFADAASVRAFYATGIGAVKALLDSGRALKLQVSASTTIDQVNSIDSL